MQDKHISRKLQAHDEICQLITAYMLRSAWISTNLSSSLILHIQNEMFNLLKSQAAAHSRESQVTV